jgi:hypothetical protein
MEDGTIIWLDDNVVFLIYIYIFYYNVIISNGHL